MKSGLFINIIVTFGIIAVVSFVGVTFAWYQIDNSGSSVNVSTEDVSVEYANTNVISNKLGIPIDKDEVATKADYCDLTVDVLKMSSSYNYVFNLSLTNIVIDNELKNSEDFRWELVKNGRTLVSGNFLNLTGDTMLLHSEIFDTVQSNTYTIRVWLNNTTSSQNELMGKKFTAKVEGSTMLNVK